jgi:HPt (histidine-containing phosphotransfer) domain-containing protein
MNDTTGMPVFDRKDFLDRVEGDMELAGQIAELFFQDSAENIAMMRTAISAKDWQALSRFAHSLKGASANLSGPRVRQAAYELELASKNGLDRKIPALFMNLEKELEDFQKALKLQIL